MIAVVGLLLTTIGGHDGVLAGIGNSDSGIILRDHISDLPSRVALPSGATVDARLMPLQEQGRTPTAPTTEPDAALANMESPSVNPASAVETVRGEELGVEGIICSFAWPQGCDYWIEVARCESTLGTDPWAYDIRNPYTGLFQIWEGHGYGYEWLKDNENNTLATWELSDEGTRTSPWPWCQYQ